MTKEEYRIKKFKETFKVGMLITCDTWKNANRLGIEESARIVYIGEEEFCIEDEDGLTTCLIVEEDWQHYSKPKLDLKGFEAFYMLHYGKGEVKSISKHFYKEKPGNDLDVNGGFIREYLTFEEATERGFVEEWRINIKGK